MACKIFFSFCELSVFSWCCLNQSTRADITKYHRLYMTSFNLNWFFNNPVAKYRHMWVRASTHKFSENAVQSKTLCPLDTPNSCPSHMQTHSPQSQVLTYSSIDSKHKVSSDPWVRLRLEIWFILRQNSSLAVNLWYKLCASKIQCWDRHIEIFHSAREKSEKGMGLKHAPNWASFKAQEEPFWA